MFLTKGVGINNVEIVGVPDSINEDCVKTVVSITVFVGINNLSASKLSVFIQMT